MEEDVSRRVEAVQRNADRDIGILAERVKKLETTVEWVAKSYHGMVAQLAKLEKFRPLLVQLQGVVTGLTPPPEY